MEQTVFLGLGAAWIAFGLAALSPGPNMVAVASTALGAGRGPSLAVACGIAFGAFFWSLSMSFGMATLFAAYPQALRVLSILGGMYLLFLGYKSVRSALKARGAEIAASGEIRSGRAFLKGLAVTATNPKVALFWASIATYVTSVTTSNLLLVLFAFAIALEALLIYAGYGLVFSSEHPRRFYGRARVVVDGGFGLVFAGLGAAVLGHAF